MTDGLPRGLVTSSQTISGDIEAGDRVAVEDITKLWKVYSANKNLLADNVGRRLENFFWRIWSNESIRSNIRGSQVAALFHTISEGGFLRTTPTQSPRNSRNLLNFGNQNRFYRSPTVSPANHITSPSNTSFPSAARDENRQSVTVHSNASGTEAGFISTSQGKQRVPRPPPILKKSLAGPSGKQAKTARVLSPPPTAFRHDRAASSSTEEDDTISEEPSNFVGQDVKPTSVSSLAGSSRSISLQQDPSSSHGRASSATDFSNGESTTSTSHASRKPAKPRTTYHVNTGGKRRPTTSRRKSSQSSSSNASSPRSRETKITSQNEIAETLPSSNKTHAAKTSGSAGPRFSQELSQDHRNDLPGEIPSEHSSEDASFEGSEEIYSGRPESLVDPDFRSKFVEKTRPSIRPSSSLSSFVSRSTTAGVTSAPYQAICTVNPGAQTKHVARVRSSVEIIDEIVPLQPPAVSALTSEAEGAQGLPRTKSQLTILLRRHRQAGGEGK